MTNQFLSNPKILKTISAIAGKEYNHYSLVLMLKSLIYKHLRITASSNVINDLIDSLMYEGSLKSFWKIDKENESLLDTLYLTN